MPQKNFRLVLSLLLMTMTCLVAMVISSGARAATQSTESTSASTSPAEKGLAAVYSDKLHGHRTASGRLYDRSKLTAAHKTLPFGTKIRVTNTKKGKSVVLQVNDRGPIQADRVLDISPRAARALGISTKGMAEVEVEVVK